MRSWLVTVVKLTVLGCLTLCSSSSWAALRVDIHSPTGFLGHRRGFVLVITNTGAEATDLVFAGPGPPFSFRVRTKGQVVRLDRRYYVSPPVTYGLRFPAKHRLAPGGFMAFYVNPFEDLVVVDPPRLRSLRKVLDHGDAQLLIECDFACPELRDCGFTLGLDNGGITAPRMDRFNVRRTLHWGAPTVVPMEHQRPWFSGFDGSELPLF